MMDIEVDGDWQQLKLISDNSEGVDADGEPVRGLVCDNPPRQFHPPLEQRGHLRIDGVDFLSDFFQIVHKATQTTSILQK